MKETKFKYKYGKYNKPTNKKVDTEELLFDEDIDELLFDEDIDDFFSFS